MSLTASEKVQRLQTALHANGNSTISTTASRTGSGVDKTLQLARFQNIAFIVSPMNSRRPYSVSDETCQVQGVALACPRVTLRRHDSPFSLSSGDLHHALSRRGPCRVLSPLRCWPSTFSVAAPRGSFPRVVADTRSDLGARSTGGPALPGCLSGLYVCPAAVSHVTVKLEMANLRSPESASGAAIRDRGVGSASNRSVVCTPTVKHARLNAAIVWRYRMPVRVESSPH